MSEHTYLGITTYIKEESYTNEGLAVLAEAIHTLKAADEPEIDTTGYEFVTQTDAYKHLYNQTNSITPRVMDLPQNTPIAYQTPQIERIDIKGNKLVRLYVPTVSEDENEAFRYVYNSLIPVLDLLFGEDIVSIKTRFGVESDSFKNLEDNVLLTVIGSNNTNRVA